MGMPKRWQKLMSFHARQDLHDVQQGPFGSVGNVSLEPIFFHINQMEPKKFHTLASPWKACMISFIVF